MPKQSKIASTRPPKTKPTPQTEPYRCVRCEKEFKYQTRNFPTSQSALYVGNNRFLPWCTKCITELYQHYEDLIGPKDAIRRLCMKFDVYWNEEIYDFVAGTERNRMLAYIGRANSIKYFNMTYDDTLDEELAADQERQAVKVINDIRGTTEDDAPAEVQDPVYADLEYTFDEHGNLTELSIPEDVIAFWGPGLTPEMYADLETRLRYWRKKYPDGYEFDAGEEALIRQICNLEVDINRARAKGQSVDKTINALNNLLGSANIKPAQKKETEGAYVPFGLEILKWENDDPIPDPDPEFEDVDGMHKNVTAWFVGHLAKMVGYKNSYVEEYEEEMKKYTLEKPSFEDEDEPDEGADVFTDGDLNGS